MMEIQLFVQSLYLFCSVSPYSIHHLDECESVGAANVYEISEYQANANTNLNSFYGLYRQSYNKNSTTSLKLLFFFTL